MEATNSRINVKFGAEKIPFSLTNTDASLWREDDGWHIRLRGQPARTDIPLDQADTGIVRLEATLRPASHLSQMPLHIEMDWRKAQLGQLSLLILGSDQDWRGDLTGELHAEGSVDALTISTRLRATGVHRAEFEPVSVLDFDANCSFLYHFSLRSLEKIECNSPVGDGHVHLTGSMPISSAAPQLTLELDRVPAQAPLDILRTLRGNFDQSLAAQGSFSGKMTYAPASATPAEPPARSRVHPALQPPGAPSMTRLHRAMGGKALPSPSLQGSFTGQGLQITGQGLTSPIPISSLVLSPAPPQPNQPPSLTAAIAVPAGAPAPLTITAQLNRKGFDLAVRGASSLPRLRDLARATGVAQADALGQITSPADASAALDLHISGPWLAFTSFTPGSPDPGDGPKTLSGSIAFRYAAWKPDFLFAPLDLGSASLRFVNGLAVWDGVSFAYGPTDNRIRGAATLAMPLLCASGQACTPHFTVRFSALDLAILQQALLGAHEQGTIISSFIDRFRPASQSTWPAAQGTLQADSLITGPFSFSGVSARLQVESHGVKITGFEARTLGGQIHGTGSLDVPTAQNSLPSYTLDASFTGINPAQIGELAGQKWSGGPINGSGNLAFSGFADGQIAATLKGNFQFDWKQGAILTPTSDPALINFTHWSGKATVGDSSLTLNENQLSQGSRKHWVYGGISLTNPPAVRFTPAADY
jgi:hypothetical protein